MAEVTREEWVATGYRFQHVLSIERNRRGLTLRELGELAGITASNISAIERGKRMPQLGTAVTLAEALGIPLAEMLK